MNTTPRKEAKMIEYDDTDIKIKRSVDFVCNRKSISERLSDKNFGRFTRLVIPIYASCVIIPILVYFSLYWVALLFVPICLFQCFRIRNLFKEEYKRELEIDEIDDL